MPMHESEVTDVGWRYLGESSNMDDEIGTYVWSREDEKVTPIWWSYVSNKKCTF